MFVSVLGVSIEKNFFIFGSDYFWDLLAEAKVTLIFNRCYKIDSKFGTFISEKENPNGNSLEIKVNQCSKIGEDMVMGSIRTAPSDVFKWMPLGI